MFIENTVLIILNGVITVLWWKWFLKEKNPLVLKSFEIFNEN
jgi:hypothetical protein